MTVASQPVESSMDLQPIDYDLIYLETICNTPSRESVQYM